MTTRTLTVATDTTTRSVAPGTNYVANTWVEVASDSAYGWLHFPRPFTRGATIISATLTLRSIATTDIATTDAARTITLQRHDRLVDFSRVTWGHSQPGYHPGEATASSSSGAAADWTFDVTAHMQAVSDGDPWWGWRIASSSTSPIRFHSAQSAYPDARPVLTVTWSDAPDEPSDLSPSAGLAVSTPTPVLRWSYSDYGGSTEQSHAQVQIASDAAITTDVWDSGVVPATEPELDLSGTSFPGLTSSTSYWRVKVRDGAGLWSDWSPVASTRYVARPTVTMTEPAGATIMDPTPTIRWTTTGVQEQYRVYVRAPGRAMPVYDSGRIASDALVHTVPAGSMLDDQTYTITVQSWDDVDRTATPGAADWSEASRTVTYDDDQATSAPSSVSASQRGLTPFVDVEWTAATTPDFFIVTRRGGTVAKVAPAEVEVEPGVYAWTDRTAVPHVENDYQVRSLIAGKRSAPVTTFVHVRVEGVWLTTDEHAACLAGADMGSPTLGSRESIHEVGDRVVVITDGLRGHEGDWSGVIHSDLTIHPGVTAKETRDAFMAIRRNPAGARLHMGPVNVPVVLSQMVVRALPHPELGYEASFTYYQAPGPELDRIDTVG